MLTTQSELEGMRHSKAIPCATGCLKHSTTLAADAQAWALSVDPAPVSEQDGRAADVWRTAAFGAWYCGPAAS